MEAILNSHTLKVLKSEMRKVKFSLNYSKLKKSELIDLMIKNKEKFSHIKMAEKKERKKPVKKEKKEINFKIDPTKKKKIVEGIEKKKKPVKKEKEVKPLLDYERLSTNKEPRTIEQSVSIRKMTKQRKNQALKIVKKEKREKEKQEKEKK